MDRVETTVHDVIAEYAKPGLNAISYLTLSEDRRVIAVVDVSVQKGQRYSDVGLLVRLVDDWIVIEYDANSDPLYEALMQAGIPRERIILAYAGETIPESKPTSE
jgi:hypothetical protein